MPDERVPGVTFYLSLPEGHHSCFLQFSSSILLMENYTDYRHHNKQRTNDRLYQTAKKAALPSFVHESIKRNGKGDCQQYNRYQGDRNVQAKVLFYHLMILFLMVKVL
jgi:hypothetical protein